MINNDNDARIIERVINRNCLDRDYAAVLKTALMNYLRNNGNNNLNANNQSVGNLTTTEVASLNTPNATLPLAGEGEHPTE